MIERLISYHPAKGSPFSIKDIVSAIISFYWLKFIFFQLLFQLKLNLLPRSRIICSYMFRCRGRLTDMLFWDKEHYNFHHIYVNSLRSD